jgi:hypothetical protein
MLQGRADEVLHRQGLEFLNYFSQRSVQSFYACVDLLVISVHIVIDALWFQFASLSLHIGYDLSIKVDLTQQS